MEERAPFKPDPPPLCVPFSPYIPPFLVSWVVLLDIVGCTCFGWARL